jgi:uncharacterized membrane protein YkvA (DUF1232 family)
MSDVPFDDDYDLEEDLRETAADVRPDRVERFYDRLRANISRSLERKGGAVEKAAEFLLMVPDVFILLWRLVNDPAVSGRNKVLLGSSIAYYIFPFDLIPEAFTGPLGYLDDLVFGVFVLNKILRETDVEVVRSHWPGSTDVLETIQRVLGAAESLVGAPVVERVKKLVK